MGQTAGQAFDAGFARGVSAQEGPERAAGGIGHVDDDAAFLLSHVGDHLAADEVSTGQVGFNHITPEIERMLRNGELRAADGGRVDDDVDATKAIPYAMDHADDGIFDADVTGHGEDVPAALAAVSLERFEVADAAGTECDVGALLGESFDEAAAKSARSAGDKDGFAGQAMRRGRTSRASGSVQTIPSLCGMDRFMIRPRAGFPQPVGVNRLSDDGGTKLTMRAILAETELAVMVVIDMQSRMMPAIAEGALVTSAVRRMLRAAAVLGVPVMHTEQNPGGLGVTTPEIGGLLPGGTGPIVKTTCSCWGDDAFRERLKRSRREHVLLAGVETHVCIQQTALDLLRVDYTVFVLADAVGSRREFEKETALGRMRDAGAIVTSVEAMMFELVRRCDVPTFKPLLEIVKQDESR